MTYNYVIFAERFHVGPDAAYVLPALFENAAASLTDTTPAELLKVATFENKELGEYLATVARGVAHGRN